MEKYEKLYKDALERAKKVNKCKADDREPGTSLCEYIFPELKESEDEKIRKEIISALKWANHKGVYNKHITWLEKQKVEPKFHKGDWITIDKPCQIISINDNGDYMIVQYCDEEKTHVLSKNFCESHFHLWTIEDAKDGDVLYAKGYYFKEYVFMYSSLTEDNVISTHFGCDAFYGTFDTKITRFGREEDFISVTPATKYQRDLLFQKMKDAGYEWDADEKEIN